jgi:hypothetical protein
MMEKKAKYSTPKPLWVDGMDSCGLPGESGFLKINKKETPFKAGSNVVLRVKLLVYASCNFLFFGFSYDAPFTDWRWWLLPRDGSTSPSQLLCTCPVFYDIMS